jgi:hypothetical protein
MHDRTPPAAPSNDPASKGGPREADEVLGPEADEASARLHARLSAWWRDLWLRLVLTLAVLAVVSAGLGQAVARVLSTREPSWVLLAPCLLPAVILALWALRLLQLRDLPERLKRLGAGAGEEGLVMDVLSDHFGHRIGVAHVWRDLHSARSLQASGLGPLLSPAWLAAAAFALLCTFGLGVLLVVGGLFRLLFG